MIITVPIAFQGAISFPGGVFSMLSLMHPEQYVELGPSIQAESEEIPLWSPCVIGRKIWQLHQII